MLPVNRELFEAWLAARELLDGKYDRTLSRDFAGEQYVADILKDAKRPAMNGQVHRPCIARSSGGIG